MASQSHEGFPKPSFGEWNAALNTLSADYRWSPLVDNGMLTTFQDFVDLVVFKTSPKHGKGGTAVKLAAKSFTLALNKMGGATPQCMAAYIKYCRDPNTAKSLQISGTKAPKSIGVKALQKKELLLWAAVAHGCVESILDWAIPKPVSSSGGVSPKKRPVRAPVTPMSPSASSVSSSSSDEYDVPDYVPSVPLSAAIVDDGKVWFTDVPPAVNHGIKRSCNDADDDSHNHQQHKRSRVTSPATSVDDEVDADEAPDAVPSPMSSSWLSAASCATVVTSFSFEQAQVESFSSSNTGVTIMSLPSLPLVTSLPVQAAAVAQSSDTSIINPAGLPFTSGEEDLPLPASLICDDDDLLPLTSSSLSLSYDGVCW